MKKKDELMENIELGNYKVATNWDDVTLDMWERYIRKADETEDKNVDVITMLECFSDIPRDVINQIPTDLFEKILNKMEFIKDEPNQEPSNKITIDGEEYLINNLEKLRVKEYLDLQTIIENDKFNYSFILALLCRQKDEVYDEEFISSKMEKRAEMFNKTSINKVMPILAFFLNLWVTSRILTQNYSMIDKFKSELIEDVRNMRNSLKLTDYFIPSKLRQIMTLRKLEKSIKNI